MEALFEFLTILKVFLNINKIHSKCFFILQTLHILSKLVLQIVMNKNKPWTLEPWHVRASFRKAGFVVPEYAIQMPPAEIKGPDLSLQEKEFYVTVTVSNVK